MILFDDDDIIWLIFVDFISYSFIILDKVPFVSTFVHEIRALYSISETYLLLLYYIKVSVLNFIWGYGRKLFVRVKNQTPINNKK